VTPQVWKELLPIIQAFVEGKPIQTKGYNGKWKDTDKMYSLLHSSYRIKPDTIVEGTWIADFKYDENREGAPYGMATLRCEGNNQDSPVWPQTRQLSLIPASVKFVPNQLKDDEQHEPENS